MSKKSQVTAAVRALRRAGVDYDEYHFDYDRHPGALGAAEFIGIDSHLTAKTIVFETSEKTGTVVLMHGDLEVSTKKLARLLGIKSARPASQDQARRWTGYEFGGTSPLGMRCGLPIFAQESLADLERVYVNAGSRGFIVALRPAILLELTQARLADLAS